MYHFHSYFLVKIDITIKFLIYYWFYFTHKECFSSFKWFSVGLLYLNIKLPFNFLFNGHRAFILVKYFHHQKCENMHPSNNMCSLWRDMVIGNFVCKNWRVSQIVSFGGNFILYWDKYVHNYTADFAHKMYLFSHFFVIHLSKWVIGVGWFLYSSWKLSWWWCTLRNILNGKIFLNFISKFRFLSENVHFFSNWLIKSDYIFLCWGWR